MRAQRMERAGERGMMGKTERAGKTEEGKEGAEKAHSPV
jgi:hypothetical protein